MKILISHVYSNDNKGDAALLSVLISDIKRGFNNPDITILTIDTIQKGETFDGVPLKNAFMYYAQQQYKNPILKVFYSIFVAVSTIFSACIYRLTKMIVPLPKGLQEAVHLYEQADLIIPVGGGYLRSKAGFMGTMNLFFIVHPFIYSYILGKPTINYTQSVGPFGNGLQEYMAKHAVKRVTGIIARENITLELLKKWGVKKNVLLSVDSGFSFTTTVTKNVREEYGIAPDKIVIGITVRNWLKSKKQEAYEGTVARLADYIIEKYNAVIIFIPQVTVELQHDDDRESSKGVYAFMEHKAQAYVVTERYDHHTIKAMYANLDYLIGTRFHSVIFSLTSYVPCIAIGYEHKTLGIMTDLGLQKWVIDIANVEFEDIAKLFDQLVQDRTQYLEHLKRVLPPYIEQSHNSIYWVKNVYENQ